MKRYSAPRRTANLTEPVHHQLNMYALAASAAGVGMLALVQPAEARIVYTRTHVVISPYGVQTYNLDLTHDGKTDFVLQTKFYSTLNQSAGTQRLIVSGASGNRLELSRGFAASLKAGKQVGPHQNFRTRGVMASDYGRDGSTFSIKRGPWVNVNNRYLGLKFKIKGKIHYGWARLSVTAQYHYLQATLTGYAYETVPNKPIIAGKTHGADDAEQPAAKSLTVPTPVPVTLGALAMGAPGLSIWRRKESIGATQ